MSSGTVRQRLLWLLVGAVIGSGGGCLGWAVTQLPAPDSLVSLGVVTGLVAVASSCTVPLWVRTQQHVSVTSAAVLVAVALLPGLWAVVCVALGVAVGQVVRRRRPTKVAFNTAKDTLGAAAAVAAAQAVGFVPGSGTTATDSLGWATVLVAMVAAAACYAAVDELLVVPVVALATGTRWQRVATRGLGVRSAGRIADMAVALGVVASVQVDGRLFVVAPLAILAIHLAYTRRLRVWEERKAWRTLLDAADALAQTPLSGDLDTVLRTAGSRAVELFPGVDAELEVAGRVAQADVAGVRIDDDAHPRPASQGPVVVAPLETELDTGPPAGWLRLRFRSPSEWTAREQQQLRSFAATVAAAVRACQAYATVAAAAAGSAHDANHDPLTGLANRRRLRERATTALARRPRRCVALLLVDLDHFKEVNDALGHAAGDRLLVEAAHRLQTAAGDHLVARLGGDEFAVLMSDVATPSAAAYQARRILGSLRAPVDIEGAKVDLTASGGVAMAGDHTDLPELLHRADVAMYQVKRADKPLRLGVDSRVEEDGAEDGVDGRADGGGEGGAAGGVDGAPSAATTRPAVDGEIEVVFQPVVALATGRATAAEALVQWRHPEFGDLPPDGSLAVIERSGLLRTVTDTVLDRAVHSAAGWQRAGFPLLLSVNLSARNLADPQLPALLLSKLDSAGLDPRTLMVELSAGSVGQIELASQGLATLRDAGVRVAFDEISPEQPRLPSISSLPVDQLKVDCTSVGGAANQPGAVAMLCAVVELGRRLDASVVGYGVVQDAQREELWRHGCASAQGPMFGGPVGVDRLLHLLHRGYSGAAGVLAPPLPAAAGHRGGVPRGHRIRGLRHGLSH